MLRREFYSRAIFVLNAIVGAALSLPAAVYLLLPGKRKSSAGWSDAGSVSSLTETPKQVLIQRKRVDAWKTSLEEAAAWVFRLDGEVAAISPTCPHLGCGVHWDAEKDLFICPCHASEFALDGQVLSGPSPRALDRFETRVEADRIWLGSVRRSDQS